jgi:class 3 adenylate cyclase/tetratricopeptide (TPR) repeat protein
MVNVVAVTHRERRRRLASRRERENDVDVQSPGERKHVTVLFADVVGFTALSEALEADAVHEIMDGCFALLTREIERYGGSVNAFTGDGVMALFGAPLAEEDHAVRALHSAFHIQQALKDYGNTMARRWGMPFQMRIGINTGTVVAGGIGDRRAVEYTALGDAINLAARLEEAAPAGGILVGPSTRREAGEAFAWRSVGPLTLKGKSEAVAAHELLGLGTTQSRFELLAHRSHTTLVGRTDELDRLLSTWNGVTDGAGRVVSIVGEAGIGKSRLLHEFKQELARLGHVIQEGSCFTYGEAISYLPFIEILRGLAAADPGAAGADATTAVHQFLDRLGLPADLAPYLLRVLGAGTDDDLVASQSSATLRIRTLQAIRDVVLAVASERPVALIVEDVHWIDKASEEVLSAIVEAMADVPLQLLLVYRPEYLHAWGDKAYHAEISLTRLGGASSAAMVRAILGKSHASRVVLERLSPADTQTMMQQILGTTEVPDELEKLVETHTEGNPLFIEELTLHLLESGDLVSDENGYRLTKPSERMELPGSIQGVFLTRIDRLDPELRRLLQVASVLGRVFSRPLLAEMTGLGEQMDQALLHLEDLDFIYATSLAPERQYSFKHVLAQEAVYQSLVRSRREAYHAQAGQTIEAMYWDRLEEFYELLAYHYGRSGNEDKAVEYLDLASQKATRANAMAEAKQYFVEAMLLLDRMPDTPANQHRRIALLTNVFLVFWMLYELPEYIEMVTEYAPLAEQIEDLGLRGMLYKHIGHCQWVFGDIEQSLATLQTAAEMCEAGGNVLGAGMAYTLMQWGNLTLGNYDDVWVWQAKSLRAFEDEFDAHHYMWARESAAFAYSQRGLWEKAVEECRESLRVGAEYHDDSIISFAAFTLCEAYTAQGDLKRAEEFGDLALRTAPTVADRVWSQSFLGGAWCRSGRAEEAAEALAPLVPLYEATQFPYGTLFNGLYLGEAYWLTGRAAEAVATLEGAVELAERTGMRFYFGSAHRLLGEVAAGTDPSDSGLALAADHFERSIQTLTAIRAEHELARAYAGYGRLLRQRGAEGEGRRYLTEALELFTRLGDIIDPELAQEINALL